MFSYFARRVATLAVLVGFPLQVHAYELIPLLTDRWCQGVFLPFGKNEVDPSIVGKPIENPALIADMPVIAVEITYPAGECDVVCQENVTLALAQSVNLWRQSCPRCHRGLMAFAVVGETVFVDGQVWRTLTANSSLVEDVLAAHETLLSLGDGSPTGTGHVMGSYVAAARSDPELTQFCQNDLSGFEGFWPMPLAAALCGDRSRHAHRRSILNSSIIRPAECRPSLLVAIQIKASKWTWPILDMSCNQVRAWARIALSFWGIQTA